MTLCISRKRRIPIVYNGVEEEPCEAYAISQAPFPHHQEHAATLVDNRGLHNDVLPP